MKNILLIVVLLVGCLAGLLLVPGVRAWLIAATLPPFPDWPAPVKILTGDESGKIYFATHSPFDLASIYDRLEYATPTTGLGYLSYPAHADEQVPAVILLPGSGGIKPGREHEYAALLNEHGYAALVIEYYAPRGVGDETNYVIRTSAVTEFDLITDAYAALELLSTSPRIDGKRIAVMGFSYGGMAARLAMDHRIHQALAPEHPGFAAHIDVYGPCFQKLGTQSTNGAPLLTLRGSNDASNDLAACALRESEMRSLGVQVEAHVYEGAGHSWENEAPAELKPDAPYLQGCEWVYDEEGVAWYNGKPLTSYDADASRAERISARMSSGVQLADCVASGYIIGRNEAVRDDAYKRVLKFLEAM